MLGPAVGPTRHMDSMESICGYAAAVDVDLPGLFSDLIRLETELRNQVEAAVQQAHGVPLACRSSCVACAGI
jgi:hypothetical protein